MKLKDALKHLKSGLLEIYDDSEAYNIATLVLESITGIHKNHLLLEETSELNNDQVSSMNDHLSRLQRHEPLQYIIGKAWFYGMELFVDNAVLIPRPEAEELVHWIINDVKTTHPELLQKTVGEADQTRTLKILDVGTGSGCIALALKKNIPVAEVWGCDKSDQALNVARRNGSALDIRVDFQGVDFLSMDQQKSLPTVDVVVSNPPYVLMEEKKEMRKNVVDHEPHEALFVPNDDPLIFYKAIAAFGHHRLHTGGKIYVEINEALAEKVVELFTIKGYQNIEVQKDMQGKERLVKAVAP